jgi:hypothetical protein
MDYIDLIFFIILVWCVGGMVIFTHNAWVDIHNPFKMTVAAFIGGPFIWVIFLFMGFVNGICWISEKLPIKFDKGWNKFDNWMKS